MPYDPTHHHRRSIRLKGFDYAQPGAYFVTIVTQNRAPLFGEIADGVMRLNRFGETVWDTWRNLPNHYAHVELDAFVVMPNHVHGLIVITGTVGAGLKPAPTESKARGHPLSEIVRALKTFSARHINQLRGTPGTPVWQRNYYEHIIRNRDEWNRARRYIAENPLRWDLDRENPQNVGA